MAKNEALKKALKQLLSAKKGINTEVEDLKPVGGGDINDAFKVVTGDGPFFLKTNTAAFEGLFEVEQNGLELLRSTKEIFVPEPIGHGQLDDGQIYLLMEFVEEAPKESNFWQNFGRQLAKMHKHSFSYFGLDHDNFIGSLPQYNRYYDNWPDFFINERIERQLRWAEESGTIDKNLAGSIRDAFPAFKEIFPEEHPALLHGDLWSGNVMTGPSGQPCIVDPAVYYGHREVDLAFSQMFGSFPEGFYEAYHEEYPLQAGFNERKDLYNLYPALVHVNLFGGMYVSLVQRIIKTVKN